MADFNDEAAHRYGKQLWAARKQAEAKLAEAEADNNTQYGAEIIEEIADIDAKGANLNRLHQSYHQPQHQQPRESIHDSRRPPANGEAGISIYLPTCVVADLAI